MPNPVTGALEAVSARRPLVRPTYNQFEVTCLPPFGDPEVSLPGELVAYLAAGVLVNAVSEWLAAD